eukprot:3579045-Heterocapsa_arctica.AAC.1
MKHLTQSEQREKEFYHDKKWKYKKHMQMNQTDVEQVHRSSTAVFIDLRNRNSKKDSHHLV